MLILRGLLIRVNVTRIVNPCKLKQTKLIFSMEELKIEYRRNLPHFLPQGATFFITFRLYGTLPLPVIREFNIRS